MIDQHATTAEGNSSARVILRWLVPLFLMSGAAALVYQVAWQRLLFQAFGADIESVTVIVSVFMLGLGCGALAGGALADRFPERTLVLFALLELATGVFGLWSPSLIRAASAFEINDSLAEVAAVNFLLLLPPTTLMGATLPILVAHVVRLNRNVGVSIGTLYFANTLGAATGAAVAGFIALYYVGLGATIQCAAALNVTISATAMLVLRPKRA